MAKVTNMTEGNPAGLIMAFSVPLMLGNICQQLYTVVDAVVVGQGLGVIALAAIGVADWFIWAAFGFLRGFTSGFGIQMSQEFGAGDRKGLRRAVANSIWLSVAGSILFTIVGLLIVGPVLHLLQTPDAVFPLAFRYLVIRFAGAAFFVAYNLFSSMLRALGDSRTPLVAMIISSFLNVGLDVLFVFGFHWGITGAAVATVIATACSALYCYVVVRGLQELKLKREELIAGGRPVLDGAMVGRLVNLSLPIALQNVIIGLGGMILTGVVNTFGVIFMAGYTATNKLYGLLENASQAYGEAMSVYAGQNYGAGDIRRIRRGTTTGNVIGVLTAALICLFMVVFGKPILMMFLSGTPEETAAALEVAYHFLVIMSVFLPVLYILYVVRAVLQGVGHTVITMGSGIAEFVMRVGSAIFLTRAIGSSGVFWAEVLAWAGADVVLITGYILVIRKLMMEVYHNGSKRGN